RVATPAASFLRRCSRHGPADPRVERGARWHGGPGRRAPAGTRGTRAKVGRRDGERIGNWPATSCARAAGGGAQSASRHRPAGRPRVRYCAPCSHASAPPLAPGPHHPRARRGLAASDVRRAWGPAGALPRAYAPAVSSVLPRRAGTHAVRLSTEVLAVLEVYNQRSIKSDKW
ncbi:hypothetical protein PVAP13_7NG315024, partial [Panicum virgatum]